MDSWNSPQLAYSDVLGLSTTVALEDVENLAATSSNILETDINIDNWRPDLLEASLPISDTIESDFNNILWPDAGTNEESFPDRTFSCSEQGSEGSPLDGADVSMSTESSNNGQNDLLASFLNLREPDQDEQAEKMRRLASQFKRKVSVSAAVPISKKTPSFANSPLSAPYASGPIVSRASSMTRVHSMPIGEEEAMRRREWKLTRNRMSAQNSRARKRQLITTLEAQVTQLQQEKDHLKSLCQQLAQENQMYKAKEYERLQQEQATADAFAGFPSVNQ